jgi:hypothetical protein
MGLLSLMGPTIFFQPVRDHFRSCAEAKRLVEEIEVYFYLLCCFNACKVGYTFLKESWQNIKVKTLRLNISCA